MTDVRHLLERAAALLGNDVDGPWLLLQVLDKPRSWLISHATDVLDEPTEAAFETMLQRRARGEPVAYIIGSQGFWSMELEVTPATLIPRPDTERLVELALERVPVDDSVRVLDLGTGSGAVALALAKERPHAQITATDLSAEALAVAQRNAERLRIGNVRFVHGSWFEPLGGKVFDLIVVNPPYIKAADPHLTRGDLRFEPLSALASGAEGLDAIRQISAGARQCLRAGGWLLFEHGWNQGKAARGILKNDGYKAVFTAPDLEQRDRVSGGQWLDSPRLSDEV